MADKMQSAAQPSRPQVAIVDYGMGNLYSVRKACETAGMSATITADRRAIIAAEAAVIPGVGAFGDAMKALEKLDLVGLLRDFAAEGRPLVGICLGLQLLMTESEEFGAHRGLDIIPGRVRRLAAAVDNGRRVKVPQVGWNRISQPASLGGWSGTMLSEIPEDEFMYFVHSYFVEPESPEAVLSVTRYGDTEFCSSVQTANLFACQFHPERSGEVGMRIYNNIRKFISQRSGRRESHV